MTARKCFIVAAGLMTASAAHAEDVPSNAELFRMLKAQQQTISELRSELKQAKQERRTATPREAREAAPAARPAGRDAVKETVTATPPVQAYAMYTKGPAVLPAFGRGAYVGVFGGGGSRSSTNVSQFGTAFFVEATGGPMAINATGQTGSGSVGFGGAHLGYEWSYGTHCGPPWRSKVSIWQAISPARRWSIPRTGLLNTPSSILSRPAPRCFWRIWLSASRRPIKTSRPISAASGRPRLH